jgi:hypothetical protein
MPVPVAPQVRGLHRLLPSVRVLVDLTIAARKASPSSPNLLALADRAQQAVEALGLDPRALEEEVIPPPRVLIDGRTVARVIYALADQADERDPIAQLAPSPLK